jgi:hypothetical protein
MKLINTCLTTLFVLALSTGSAIAQDSDSSRKYHPFLSENFHIGLGAFRPTKSRSLGGSTSIGSGASDSLDSTEDQSTGILNFRWRFTKNWHFQTTYWQTDSSTTDTLNKDYESPFDDLIFKQGSSISSGIDTSILRLFWGRSFFRKPNHDWGVGLGLHWLEIDASIQGTVDIVNPTPPPAGIEIVDRAAGSVSAPLPNMGIWYMYSWSPKWVVTTRLDWLDITFEEFSGSMYDASVGVNYQMSKHFGIGIGYNAFKLDVDVRKTEWDAGFETKQYGPRINITWNW